MRQDVLPDEVKKILDESPAPEFVEPPDSSFELAAGYLDLDNRWHRDFTVRELTGRDEEAIGAISRVGPLVAEIIQRGLVSVGPYRGHEAMNGIAAGDWETVLLAIRIATFGESVDLSMTCSSCRNRYEVSVNLRNDIPTTQLTEPSDMQFTVTGRHGAVYTVAIPLGSTHRKMLQNLDQPVSQQSTLLLNDCVEKIDGKPALPETIGAMPLLDRRTILAEIAKRRPGPRPQEVTTLCPSCGAENNLNFSIAALFQ